MAANTPMLIVKITDGETIRRFTSSADSLTYASVHKRANEAFRPQGGFKLQYTDDENDIIVIDTDDELEEAVALALSNEPSVLRLQLKPEIKSTSTSTTTGTQPVPESEKKEEGNKSSGTSASPAAPDLSQLIQNITKELPTLVNQLPEAIQRMIPHAALDVEATLNATAAAANAAAANAASVASNINAQANPKHAPPGPDLEGFHPGVTCDRTDMSPLVGVRYNLIGHDYDICEAEYQKLSDTEKLLYRAIPPPMWRPRSAGDAEAPSSKKEFADAPKGFHPGVTCDKSGMCPIVGYRYHLVGRNYDLCQTEFDKLSAEEKTHFQRIAPPPARQSRCGGGGGGGGFYGGGGGGGGGFDGGFGGFGGFGGGGGGGGGWRFRGGRPDGGPKLAARFISDVSIHDGTEMSPGSRFTKIWRLKNVGEQDWPAGTKLMCVGGDSMSADLTVALPTKDGVRVNEEVEVAVDMVAPPEHGRYIGYWRLAGPAGYRKFGQRVWCHIQVVDPSAPSVAPSEIDIKTAASTPRGLATDGDEASASMDASDVKPMDMEPANTVEPPAEPPAEPAAIASIAAAVGDLGVEDRAEHSFPVPKGVPMGEAVETADVAMDAPIGGDVAAVALTDEAAGPVEESLSDEGELVGETAAEAGVEAELAAMGFADGELVRAVLAKVGPNLERCLDELASLAEYEKLLEDLAEMGFTDRSRNKLLLVRYNGDVKKTVKALVTEPAPAVNEPTV